MGQLEIHKHELLTAHLVYRAGVPKKMGDQIPGFNWTGKIVLGGKPTSISIDSYFTPRDQITIAKSFLSAVEDSGSISQWQFLEYKNRKNAELVYLGTHYAIPFADLLSSPEVRSRAAVLNWEKLRAPDQPLYLEDLDLTKTTASRNLFSSPKLLTDRLVSLASVIAANPQNHNL